MLIAKAKRRENIIEYLLYMYQIEDIIRSMNFDMDSVKRYIVDGFDQPDEVKERIFQWYINLTESLIREDKTKSGHLSFLINEVEELQKFHSKLMTIYQDKRYQQLYENAKPVLVDLVMRSGGKTLINEIDVAMNGVYGYLVLKLKRVEVSEATETGIQKIKEMLAYLALKHRLKEEGKLPLTSNEN